VTIEDSPTETPESTFVKLQQIDGVVNASLAYQYCDNASEEELKP
jgi:nitrate reductase NapAB chaperone NapD